LLSSLAVMKDLISCNCQQKMKSLIKQILIILLAVNIFSCASNKEGPVKIRVVSLQGTAKPVNIKTPDLNIQALREQGTVRSSYVEISPPGNNRITNYDTQKNSFYQKKYNSSDVQPDMAIEQEVVYRNEFDKKPEDKSNKVKYILDSNNHQGNNPIIIQNNSNVKDITSVPDNDKTVEIDLSSEDVVQKKPKKRYIARVKKIQAPQVTQNGYFVQVGAFKNKINADRSLAYMKKYNEGFVKYSNTDSSIKYKVVLGPFPKRSDAQTLYKDIKQSGHDALIIKTSY